MNENMNQPIPNPYASKRQLIAFWGIGAKREARISLDDSAENVVAFISEYADIGETYFEVQ